jgi:hypothetical protein
MVRIGENNVRAKPFKIVRAYRLYRSTGADRHKNRCRDFSPVDNEFANARAASPAGM